MIKPLASTFNMEYYFHPLGEVPKAKQHSELISCAKELASCKNSFLIAQGLDMQSLNLLFALYLIESGKPRYTRINIHDTVEIAFHKHDAFNSIESIGNQCLLIWGGYNEMENKLTQGLALDLLDRRILAGRKTCLVLNRGRYTQLEKKLSSYPESVCLTQIISNSKEDYNGFKIHR